MTRSRFLLPFLAFLFAIKAHALPVGNAADPVYTTAVAVATYTVVTVNVSTSTATQVDAPQLSKRLAVEIQNIDLTANLWCGPTASVSVNGSRKVSAGNAWGLNIRDTTTLAGNAPIIFYCLSDGAATTKAIVTQVR